MSHRKTFLGACSVWSFSPKTKRGKTSPFPVCVYKKLSLSCLESLTPPSLPPSSPPPLSPVFPKRNFWGENLCPPPRPIPARSEEMRLCLKVSVFRHSSLPFPVSLQPKGGGSKIAEGSYLLRSLSPPQKKIAAGKKSWSFPSRYGFLKKRNTSISGRSFQSFIAGSLLQFFFILRKRSSHFFLPSLYFSVFLFPKKGAARVS